MGLRMKRKDHSDQLKDDEPFIAIHIIHISIKPLYRRKTRHCIQEMHGEDMKYLEILNNDIFPSNRENNEFKRMETRM